MSPFTTRPIVRGKRGVVTSGHYLATAAGFRIMEQGGNAIDAAAAMGFCLALLEPQSNGIGGEVPTLVYAAQEKKVYALSGVGWTPATFTIDWCREHQIDLIPGDGYLPACVPAIVGTWAEAVARWGTMSLGQVTAPAIELAEEGLPMYEGLHNSLVSNQQKFTELYPSSGEVYCPGGRVPEVGELVRYPDWAESLKTVARAEKEAQGQGRIAAIEAGADAFYRGPIAERIARFIQDNPVLDASGQEHTGLLTYEDMAEWHATVEEPVKVTYRGREVYKCPTWTQGPVFLQQLALLEGYDLAAMGHNSPEYLHVLIECAKLAFADREAYYGDPRFDDVPMDILLSPDYNEQRRGLIGDTASREMRPGAVDPNAGIPEYALDFDVRIANQRALQMLGKDTGGEPTWRGSHSHTSDTTHLDAVDAAGNMVASTPSGGWIGSSPVIRGLGFPLGTRGQMFYLDPNRPNALAGRKRPRATLTPSLVLHDDIPYMVFGTPGGDCQDQWTLQFFLNYVDFDMTLQEALDAPTVHSEHFPSSFYPRQGYPARVVVEDRLAEEVLEALRQRGHDIRVTGDWANGKTMAIRYDSEQGTISGGAAPKGIIGYALAW